MKLIQVSDLHYLPPGMLLLGIDPRARLEAAIDDINRHHSDAALCLFTGDLADRGESEAYDALRETLAVLQIPYRLTIGNHDDRDHFLNAFPDAPRDENGFVQTVVATDGGQVILIDTNHPGRHTGDFCARRQAWLKARLESAGDEAVYLFMHHPPLDIGIPSMDKIGLVDKQGFSRTIEGAGIRHIFFGHVHRPISGSWRGIPYSSLCSMVHQVPLDFVTVDSVPYDLAPPAYNVILIDGDNTVVHHHEFLDDSTLPPGTTRYTPITSSAV